MSLGPVVCQHDPMTAQRVCLCDPACVCRVAGNCVTTSGDVLPSIKKLEESVAKLAGSDGAEVMMYSTRIPLRRAEGDQWVPSGDEVTLSGVPSPRDRAQHCESGECKARGECCLVAAACTSKLMTSRAELLKPVDVAVHKHADGTYGAGIDLTQIRQWKPDDDTQQCACGANTPEGQHEFSAYCTSNWDPPTGPDIEVVPKERLRAELTAWQDEWPGIDQLDGPEK